MFFIHLYLHDNAWKSNKTRLEILYLSYNWSYKNNTAVKQFIKDEDKDERIDI